MKTCSPQLHVLTIPCENETSHSYFYNALLVYYPLHQAWWCEAQSTSSTKKQTDSHKVCSKRPWHEHKHASVLAMVNCFINQRLLEGSPHMQQTLSQLINVTIGTVTSYLRHM